MGFRQTVVVRRPTESLLTGMSKKGIVSSFSISVVKRIVGCWLSRCKNLLTSSRSKTLKVSSTYRFQIPGLQVAFSIGCFSNTFVWPFQSVEPIKIVLFFDKLIYLPCVFSSVWLSLFCWLFEPFEPIELIFVDCVLRPLHLVFAFCQI